MEYVDSLSSKISLFVSEKNGFHEHSIGQSVLLKREIKIGTKKFLPQFSEFFNGQHRNEWERRRDAERLNE